MSHYVIHGALVGAQRMEVVARACRHATLPLLQRAGIREGLCCLDLGCGAGEVTFEIARLIGSRGRVVGIDMDSVKLDIARKRSATEGPGNVEFRQGDVFAWDEDAVYDFIYLRFLLTHLPRPERIIPQLLRALRPGGALAVEDVDFLGCVSYPACAAHDRYADLYREVVRRRGGDADIGPKLLSFFAAAGAENLNVAIVYPEQPLGTAKQVTLLTIIGISEALLAEKLIGESELNALIADLETYMRDPLSIVSGPRIFQVWGRRGIT